MAAVEMRYLGHSSFLWTTAGGTRVVIDPYDNTHPHDWRWFVQPFPEIEADLVLVTHDHFDHNATHRIGGDPRIVRGPEEIRTPEVAVVGFGDRHAHPDDMTNTVFLLELGGVRLCHLGDNRPDVPQDVVDAIGRVDVLVVPVDDSSHLLRFWEVGQLVETFGPRVVVPVHYLIPGLTDPGSTLLPADTWLGTQHGVRHLGTSTIEVGPDSFPVDREVWVFEPPAGR
jgi:L-ascorbate metabolism protein UlaG (beta-lactamase superfamily)